MGYGLHKLPLEFSTLVQIPRMTGTFVSIGMIEKHYKAFTDSTVGTTDLSTGRSTDYSLEGLSVL